MPCTCASKNPRPARPRSRRPAPACRWHRSRSRPARARHPVGIAVGRVVVADVLQPQRRRRGGGGGRQAQCPALGHEHLVAAGHGEGVAGSLLAADLGLRVVAGRDDPPLGVLAGRVGDDDGVARRQRSRQVARAGEVAAHVPPRALEAGVAPLVGGQQVLAEPGGLEVQRQRGRRVAGQDQPLRRCGRRSPDRALRGCSSRRPRRTGPRDGGAARRRPGPRPARTAPCGRASQGRPARGGSQRARRCRR
jgi:hypothetical protein